MQQIGSFPNILDYLAALADSLNGNKKTDKEVDLSGVNDYT